MITCRNSNLSRPAAAVCGTWNATIAFCFFNFVLYGVSAVFAGLDLKDGKGMVKPRGRDWDPGFTVGAYISVVVQ